MPITRAVSNRRLLKLAAFLEKLPRKRFEYSYWVGTDWKGKTDLSCGTTACALGWATTIPEFRVAGLKLTQRGDPINYRAGATGFSAAQGIFGISWDQAHSLFMPSTEAEHKATPKYVARKIRRFVKERA